MENLDMVIEHLRKLPDSFFGQIIIKVKHGRAVHLTEEKSIKLDDEQDSLGKKQEEK